MTLKRLRDKDNLYGGCKDLIDSLVRLGWLVDDSPQWLELHVKQVKGRTPRTEIELAQIGDSDGKS